MPSSSYYDWCFTLNWPNGRGHIYDEDYDLSEYLGSGMPGIGYLCCQLERGDSRTPHLQGFVSFERRITLSSAKRILSEFLQLDGVIRRVHMERRRGTVAEAIAYVTKEDSRVAGPWEYGCRPNEHGGRRDPSGGNPQFQRFVTDVRGGRHWRELLVSEEHAPLIARCTKWCRGMYLTYYLVWHG